MFSPFSLEAPSTYRLLSFGRELAKRGNNIKIVLPGLDRYSGFMADTYLGQNGVELIRPYQFRTKVLETSLLPFILSSVFRSLILKCDIIHVLKPNPVTFPGYIAKIMNNAPLIQDIDDLDHAVMTVEKHPKMRIWLTEKFESYLPKHADHILTSSSYLKRFYLNLGIGKDRITWIPSGVDCSKFERKSDLPLKGQCNLKSMVIVYVGSLNIGYNVSLLIRSMKLIVKERKDVSCLIIGDGTQRPSLQKLVQKLGLTEYVVFTGRVHHEEISKYLSISDIGFACFPKEQHYMAASNLKVFEYMAAGVPPVVSSVGDLPYYTGYGNAGAIVEFDVESVSKLMIDLLQDEKKRKRLGENARRHVKNNFDWQLLTKKLFHVYQEIARDRFVCV